MLCFSFGGYSILVTVYISVACYHKNGEKIKLLNVYNLTILLLFMLRSSF